jgi:cytochrome c553
MKTPLVLSFVLPIALGLGAGLPALADDADAAAKELEKALHLTPDIENGKRVYLVCSVCHMPEGWGSPDGAYPQIAGQLTSVAIKQLADIRARNRDNPTMLPFTMLNTLSIQDIADVSAYVEGFPMDPNNGVGPGTDLEHGARLYAENCEECHGARGEGIAAKHMPLIQGQHFKYLMRQFEWIRDGKRRNADKEMVEQIQSFSDRDMAAVLDYTSRLKPPVERLAAPGYLNPDFPSFWRQDNPKGHSLLGIAAEE